MSTRRQITHEERERATLDDLEASFPNFAGQSLEWSKVHDSCEPPDFVSACQGGPIGLELTEWLDGDQMTSAKARESQRDQVHRVLAKDWESEYKPTNLVRAFVAVGNESLPRIDETLLRREFFACVAEVDGIWRANPDRTDRTYEQRDFPDYPLMQKYFRYVRYAGGKPLGLSWIRLEGDGGAYDPTTPVETLKIALDNKLKGYSKPEAQAHLNALSLTGLYLLVHGGFNVYAYNTPQEPFSLTEIARRGAAFYADHPKREVFQRAWFFHSLDSADDLNQVIGLAPGSGRVRFLAQLWPEFRVC